MDRMLMLLIIVEEGENEYMARTNANGNLIVGEHADSIFGALDSLVTPLLDFEDIDLWECDVTVLSQPKGQPVSESVIRIINVQDMASYDHGGGTIPDYSAQVWMNENALIAGYGISREEAIKDLAVAAFSDNFVINHVRRSEP